MWFVLCSCFFVYCSSFCKCLILLLSIFLNSIFTILKKTKTKLDKLFLNFKNLTNNPHEIFFFICICPWPFILIVQVHILTSNLCPKMNIFVLFNEDSNNALSWVLRMSFFSSSPLCSVGKIGSGEPSWT